MQKLSIHDLQAGQILHRTLFSGDGKLLAEPGQEVTYDLIEQVVSQGVDDCILTEPPFDRQSQDFAVAIQPADLPVNIKCPAGIYDVAGQLLIKPGQQVTEENRKKLIAAGHQRIWVEQGQTLGLKETGQRTVDNDIIDDDEISPKRRKWLVQQGRHLADQLDKFLNRSDACKVTISGPPMSRRLERRIERSTQDRAAFQSLRRDMLKKIEQLNEQLRDDREVQFDLLISDINKILNAFRRDYYLALAVGAMTEPDASAQTLRLEHTFNLIIYAIAIGTALGYDEQHLRELAAAAILCDVGLTIVPKSVRWHPGPLSEKQRALINLHPYLSLGLAGSINNMPTTVLLGIYQCHERETGTGYPQGENIKAIHPYGHILAVADTYLAIRSPRCFRKAARPYDAMATVVHAAADHGLDAKTVKALLKAAGLFPVGSWVRLSNKSIGRVISTGESKSIDRPDIAVHYDGNGKYLIHAKRLRLAKEPELKIIEVLDADAIEKTPLMGF